MSLFEIVFPPAPFDYGDCVEWADGNGRKIAGSIFGFDLGRETAQIELPDGTATEVPLAKLTILS